ncbi:MAG: lysine transporter LysE [Candidatus Aquiluna sp. XM-24bin5]|nr:MAG: lysine transporter LysE [Candidatus Aquiluna sp. XM-24bin5]
MLPVPSAANILGFTLLAIVIIVVPGPGVLFAVGRALVLGTKPALLSVLGNALGVGVQIVVVALGLGVLIQSSPEAFFVIRLAGALMIGYLGIRAILHRRQSLEDGADKPHSRSTILKESVVVGLTNAKTLVFFLAALPSFVSVEDGSPIIQMLLLGLIFSIIGIASDSVYAIAAGRARDWLATSEQRLATFRGLGGLALTLLGVYMLYEAIAH